jgi:soluble lytic murein transglycosylase
MQLMPETADYIAEKSGGTRFVQEDLADPQVNIAYGSWYLRYLLDKYDGREVLALAAYNAGQTNVDGWLADAAGEHLAPTDIPFGETRHYVAKVLDARDDYRREYKDELGL